jgi:hypothetical protein
VLVASTASQPITFPGDLRVGDDAAPQGFVAAFDEASGAFAGARDLPPGTRFTSAMSSFEDEDGAVIAVVAGTSAGDIVADGQSLPYGKMAFIALVDDGLTVRRLWPLFLDVDDTAEAWPIAVAATGDRVAATGWFTGNVRPLQGANIDRAGHSTFVQAYVHVGGVGESDHRFHQVHTTAGADVDPTAVALDGANGVHLAVRTTDGDGFAVDQAAMGLGSTIGATAAAYLRWSDDGGLDDLVDLDGPSNELVHTITAVEPDRLVVAGDAVVDTVFAGLPVEGGFVAEVDVSAGFEALWAFTTAQSVVQPLGAASDAARAGRAVFVVGAHEGPSPFGDQPGGEQALPFVARLDR